MKTNFFFFKYQKVHKKKLVKSAIWTEYKSAIEVRRSNSTHWHRICLTQMCASDSQHLTRISIPV